MRKECTGCTRLTNRPKGARELTAVAEASRALHCDNLTLIAISDTRTETLNDKTIHIISATDWLLGQQTTI